MNANDRVELGEVVFWFPEGEVNQAPTAALVTAIGLDAVDVALFQPGHDRHSPRLGVRHVDNKRAKSFELREAGGWCHRKDWFSRGEVDMNLKAAAGSAEARDSLDAQGKVPDRPLRNPNEAARDRPVAAK